MITSLIMLTKFWAELVEALTISCLPKVFISIGNTASYIEATRAKIKELLIFSFFLTDELLLASYCYCRIIKVEEWKTKIKLATPV